ncbi:uncharacterized protein LOC129565503 isoform X2 [Sitodiplosis mosellana]|uniref:uncharacterized protein LOC129565503 isoform X2 n=1 Tax=Sitodiplosis mosellana TaxID=263140 RepID=UPI0024450B5B|nr:uncharacterized protein LOC129565503 isoform X2 [Sitodiplosis mosellana]
MDTKMDIDSEGNVSGLFDFPNEVLLPLMSHLNDTTLWNMTRVCKRFKAIAKEAFAKKYNGATGKDYYALEVYPANMTEQHKQYRPFFTIFGENMIAVKIKFIDKSPVANSHWIMGLIQRYCTTLVKIMITGTDEYDIDLSTTIVRMKTRLTHLHLVDLSIYNYSWIEHNYPNLIELYADNFKANQIERFIDNNRQLQKLCLTGLFYATKALHSFSGKLDQLMKLQIQCYADLEYSDTTTPIELCSLEALFVFFRDEPHTPLLRSIAEGCKNIVVLKIDNAHFDIYWNDEMIDAMCGFGQLKSLSLCATTLTAKHIKQMIQQLSNLSSLSLDRARIDDYDLLVVISICSQLTELEIIVDYRASINKKWPLDFNLLVQIAEITARNRVMVKLRPCCNCEETVFTQGEVRRGNSIVYWSGYDPMDNQTKLTLLDLRDECLEEIISYLDMDAQAALYNTCTQTQKAVKVHLSNSPIIFHVSSSNYVDEHDFQSLAPSIRQMIVMHKLSFEHWKLINRYCTNLIELNMAVVQKHDIYRISFSWPKLEKLMFIECTPRALRSFECPMLTYLKVHQLKDEMRDTAFAHTVNFHDLFRQLSVFKFGCYNDSVETFLRELSDSVCHQLQELSVENMVINTDREFVNNITNQQLMKLVSIASRCHNVTTLCLIIPGIENAYGVKANCIDIKSIQIAISDNKCDVFHRSSLQYILQMFPDVSITLAISIYPQYYGEDKVYNRFVFPVTAEFVKNSVSMNWLKT